MTRCCPYESRGMHIRMSHQRLVVTNEVVLDLLEAFVGREGCHCEGGVMRRVLECELE